MYDYFWYFQEIWFEQVTVYSNNDCEEQVYFGEYLLENIHKMNLIMLGVYIVIGYLIVLVAYSVLTYIQYSVQYYRAKKSVREYYSQLTELNKIYAREEKKSSGRGNAGGYRK